MNEYEKYIDDLIARNVTKLDIIKKCMNEYSSEFSSYNYEDWRNIVTKRMTNENGKFSLVDSQKNTKPVNTNKYTEPVNKGKQQLNDRYNQRQEIPLFNQVTRQVLASVTKVYKPSTFATKHGKPWDLDDLKTLREDFTIRKVPASILAEKLGRTECSIYCKLETMKLISSDDNPYHEIMEKRSTNDKKDVTISASPSQSISKQANTPILNQYIEYFTHLKRSIRNGEVAPHKLVLLLAVLEQIHINSAYWTALIPLDDALIKKFESIWKKYVKSSVYNPDISMPYFHMNSEPFWSLVSKSQDKITFTNTPSTRTIQYCYKGAKIDVDLLNLAKNESSYLILQNTLLKQLPGYALVPQKKNERNSTEKLQSNPLAELSNHRKVQGGENYTLRQHENIYFDFIVPDFTEIKDAILDILKKNFKLHNADMVVEVENHDEDPNYGYFEYGYVNFSSNCMPYIARRILSVSGGTKYRLFTFERIPYLNMKKKPFDFDDAIEHLIISDIF